MGHARSWTQEPAEIEPLHTCVRENTCSLFLFAVSIDYSPFTRRLSATPTVQILSQNRYQ